MTDTAPTETLATQYDPAAVEVPTYLRWLRAGYFGADEQRVLSGERKPFSIVLPPPNVTGNLHVGHALDHTLMDVQARWHRMSGDEVLWLPGMDHAGIATQTIVEKQLAVDGKTRHDFGRELFVEKVWDWKHESGGAILGQMRRLGDSVDWSRERFTLDDGLSAAVQTIFKDLYDDGLIYRAERIINWCPGCQTAISDIEVDHTDDAGELVSVRYGDGDDAIVVATTRVETMLGDTAIAVHPDDERYTHLVGRTVTLPLVGRELPIIADEHVDPSFGTGAVKVTPAHDPNDFEIGRRHGLPAINILTEDARIDGTGTVFDGLDRFDARAAVKEALAGAGPGGGREGAVHPRRRALLPFRRRRRTPAVAAVVRQGRPAGQGSRRRGPGRPHRDPSAGTGRPVLRLGRQHARLDDLAPAVVGAPHPGLVFADGRGALHRS